MRNLDVTTLRSFLTVAQAGGVTRAAGLLNLTQSAVSMQIKRLEEILDTQLLERAGRSVALTPSGQQLLGYAERMVELNDEAFARLTHKSWTGTLRLGVPEDIVYPVIPDVLRRFGRAHPKVKIELLGLSTRNLKDIFSKGEVEVILTTEAGIDPNGETLSTAPLRWFSAPDSQALSQRPLPVGFCRYCAFRESAMNSLNAAGVEWDSAIDSENDRAVEVAVTADLAVTAMLEGHAPRQFEQVSDDKGLPPLDEYKINMYCAQTRPDLIGELAGYIRQGFAAL